MTQISGCRILRDASAATSVGIPPRILPLLAALLALPASLPALAVPRLDLTPYPPPSPGTVRWVVQLPGVLRPSPDGSRLSPDPADWRVEILVGREQPIACNLEQLQGEIRSETVPGWGYTLYRVSGGGAVASTRMACPPGAPRRPGFITLAGPALLAPYNPSLPIVVDAPRGLQVRWRLWKAERQQQRAWPQP